MAEQERKRSPADRRRETAGGDGTGSQAADDQLASRIDDLLDEVDSVLEENAEEFVKNYVQKGGQ